MLRADVVMQGPYFFVFFGSVKAVCGRRFYLEGPLFFFYLPKLGADCASEGPRAALPL
jgi:hypothetical protein